MSLPRNFRDQMPRAGLALVERSCERKRAYRSELSARWSLAEWRGKFPETLSPTLTVYACPFCGEWHIGHGHNNNNNNKTRSPT